MAENAEGLAELFFARLKTTNNVGVVLAQFYGALLGVEVGRVEIMGFNRLTKIFGKSLVFFSIIDISRKESFPEFPFGLLFKICKDKLEASLETEMTLSSFRSLERMITETEKDISKVKKIDPDKAMKYLESKEEK